MPSKATMSTVIGKQVIDGVEYDTFRVEPGPTVVSDLLLVIAPPLRMVAWLELVFENKRAKGEQIPEAFTKWLERWQRIRSDLPCDIDGATEEQWLELERKLFTKEPAR